MKEARYFYVPDAALQQELPQDEAQHAVRVLRLKAGDEIFLMDGTGGFYRASVTDASARRCGYEVVEHLPQQPAWHGHLHLAIAPTKMMDRMEWMVEKATEVGIDELSFLECQFSERRHLKTERLDKIVVSAMKQSRKAWKPRVNDLLPFDRFLANPPAGRKFIAHCYEEVPRVYLFDELRKTSPDGDSATGHNASDATVLVGPEGDFSLQEVRRAVDAGFQSVHLGSSRLRTETAGLAAVMMMQLARQILLLLLLLGLPFQGWAQVTGLSDIVDTLAVDSIEVFDTLVVDSIEVSDTLAVDSVAVYDFLLSREIFTMMPDSLIPTLSENNRLDMIDFIDSGMKAEVDNLLGGKSEMTELSDYSLVVRLSEAATLQLLLLVPTKPVDQYSQVICMVQTFGVDSLSRHTVVNYYDLDWQRFPVAPPLSEADKQRIKRLEVQTILNWEREILKKD